ERRVLLSDGSRERLYQRQGRRHPGLLWRHSRKGTVARHQEPEVALVDAKRSRRKNWRGDGPQREREPVAPPARAPCPRTRGRASPIAPDGRPITILRTNVGNDVRGTTMPDSSNSTR